MVASDGFSEFLRDQLAPLGRITMRRMFGKTGVFCDGAMFAMVSENTLYIRVDDQNRTKISYPDVRRIAVRHGIAADDPNVVALAAEADKLGRLGAGVDNK